MQDQQTKLRHIVLFKFKSETTAEQIQQIETAFAELPSKINHIQQYESGINNSPERLNKGFTHCFSLTFNSELDRDHYLPHPAHEVFKKFVEPYLEDVLVMDYWVNC